ncbi:MAG: biotin transporter BioY, partial [Lachnospiraceae bacterium]|nr:biotin transporter BioY [Lachnospiraceae bacterium]
MNRKYTTLDLIYMAIGAALIAACSWITIPFMVPFTLQTFAVFTIVGLLGGRKGFLSILVYILLGAVGLPVFSGFKGGIGVLAGTTGGYIIGFLFIALIY